MTGKNYNWHKAWSRDGDRLKHISGLVFIITRGDDYTDIIADQATLDEFQAYEKARDVPVHAIVERLQRLLREATKWLEHERKNK